MGGVGVDPDEGTTTVDDDPDSPVSAAVGSVADDDSGAGSGDFNHNKNTRETVEEDRNIHARTPTRSGHVLSRISLLLAYTQGLFLAHTTANQRSHLA
jgi:hypothetical protein